MGVSIRALFEAGVKEGKISSSELRRIELPKDKVTPSWFKLPERHVSGHAIETEDESE